MALEDNPILLSCARLLVGLFIGRENLKLYDRLDWEDNQFNSKDFSYPEYYQKNYHGISGGYLNSIAPVTYDAVTRFAAPPNETRLRKKAIALVKNKPKKILDLGCGTGSSTLMLKKAFPDAEVIGFDVSPYMLLMAEYKGKQANLDIHWQQGLAEATDFDANEFDLVSIAFLFHETPVEISQQILNECWRILKPQGEIIVVDGNQKRLRRTDWLIELFREPYSKVYAAEDINNWLRNAGFSNMETNSAGWISQITTGIKNKAK